ncbi:ribosome small subunit-dependent GTPase A [Lacticaseibacillus pantheris]|uniref:ribosome small subunit-dependent GTPase A n=1 Tax=Lacticaseibacillus pantheris TaxID=171523 RepID=UPI002657EFE6|nr:ribosome small subunit-dependent GTPase A [Lacticaseibacillus pantheris]WKF84890.1 ribosome small subunit-dependent GTPase A [Lacticaseibacillus pantheris]
MKLTEYGNTSTQNVVAGLTLARVTALNHQQYTIVTDAGQFSAQVAGRMLNFAVGPEDFPTVGDWVQVRLPDTPLDLATIERLNVRNTVFLRKGAGRGHEAQLVAANVDWLLLCMSLDGNFNLRRLERYLAVAAASGAQAAVVLTKADLAQELPAQELAVQDVIGIAPLIICDASRPDGVAALAEFMQSGLTYAFLGSSGVGKSTLINRLSGEQTQSTQAVRTKDAHGRHTTTSRQLLRLGNGSLVIDTPGMRELGLVEADVDATFSDVLAFAAGCRFSDCTHQQEPGCAVRQAVADGHLDAGRLTSYLQLRAEQAENVALRGKARENAKIDRMFGSKKQMKAMMKVARRKRR